MTDRVAWPDDAGRHESPEERDDRNLQELRLQELRVAAIGVQVLFGFLLAMPFTTRFRLLDGVSGARRLEFLLAAVATALLAGPVAYHRFVFRLHEKERLVRAADVMAIAGLGAARRSP